MTANIAGLQDDPRQEQDRADAEPERHQVVRREGVGEARARRYGVRSPDDDGECRRCIAAYDVPVMSCKGHPLPRRRRRTAAAYAAMGRCGSRFGLTMLSS